MENQFQLNFETFFEKVLQINSSVASMHSHTTENTVASYVIWI